MLRSVPVIILCACAPAVGAEGGAPPGVPGAEPAAAEGASDPGAMPLPPLPGLSLTATVPHPGGTEELVVTGANAGERVGFWASGGGVAAGQGPCLAQLGGLCLDLGANTVFAGIATADASGRAELDGLVPAGLVQGAAVTFQAAVARGVGGASSVKSSPVAKTVGAPAWSNPIVVDGSLADWSADEEFATTSGNNTLGGVTWDADFLYVAFDHPDVANGGPQHWEEVYVGTGAPGSTVGVPLHTQTPDLGFEASLVLRRKADGSYDDLQVWDEGQGQWVGTPSVLGTMGSSAAESGQTLELAIPRALLGSTHLQVVLVQAYEGNGFESTYGGVPSDSFVDGYDPDYATWLTLDLSSPNPSAVQNP